MANPNPKPRAPKLGTRPREIPRVKSDKERGTEGWISRNQAADLMGVAPSALLYWERAGRITAKVALRYAAGGNLCETVVYDPYEILKLPRRSLRPASKDPDELAARVTECIELGWTDRAIVIELRVDYAKVARLREMWLDGGGRARTLTPDLEDRLIELVGPFESMPEMVDRIRDAMIEIGEARREITAERARRALESGEPGEPERPKAA